jgi:MOSC domain-containing protein YiiM
VSNVIGLYTCPNAGQPMEAQTQVRALAGSGFAGDRYAANQGTFSRSAILRHVSLIAREAIEEANRVLVERGLAPFGVHETRRNIITDGVDVNALLGREFRIGDVRMRGTEPTRPCLRPSALVRKTGFAEAFATRGGVRAEVLSDGIISIGDLITFERLEVSEQPLGS